MGSHHWAHSLVFPFQKPIVSPPSLFPSNGTHSLTCKTVRKAAPLSSELKTLFTSFQKCLDLRDKYMRLSLQRLGDNPRDHDGGHVPTGDVCDVSGLRADVPDSAWGVHPQALDSSSGNDGMMAKWKMHPPAPPPHWHPNNLNNPNAPERPALKHEYESARRFVGGNEEFDFDKIEIPGEDKSWEYGMDDRGVFQIYDSARSAPPSGSGESPLSFLSLFPNYHHC